MKSIQWCKKFATVYICLMLFPVISDANEKPLPDDLTPALEYFYSVSKNHLNQSVSLSHVKTLLRFVDSEKGDSEIYFADHLFDSSGAYFDYDVSVSLNHVLKYAYDTRIPSHLFSPAAIRLCTRLETDDQWNKLSDMAYHFPNLNKPVVMRASEYAETTPDVFSGAYYGYHIDRTIILCKADGRTVLISLSKQTRPSSIGKKGFVMGEDEEWNYFYSEEKGLTKQGLGWADTFMYDSFSITVQSRSALNGKGIRSGIFSWVNAGWSGINVVKPKHIHNGLKRFARSFKEVIESPLLPKPDEIIRMMTELNTFSTDALQKNVQDFYTNIFETVKNRSESDFTDKLSELVRNHDNYEQMTPDEMKAFLLLEHMKDIINKNSIKKNKILLGNQSSVLPNG